MASSTSDLLALLNRSPFAGPLQQRFDAIKAQGAKPLPLVPITPQIQLAPIVMRGGGAFDTVVYPGSLMRTVAQESRFPAAPGRLLGEA